MTFANKSVAILSIASLLSSSLSYSQSCPIFDRRNNGNGGASTCGASTPPSALVSAGYNKTGEFQFVRSTSPNAVYTRNKVWQNGVLYQDGANLVTPNTIWFGDYIGTNNPPQICFYATNTAGNNGVPPAANWTFELQSGTTTFTCTINTAGTTFDAGTISGNQTICSGSTPAPFTSTAAASGSACTGSPTYQWQRSTVSSTSGYADIAGANQATYSAGALTQTTYFQRVANCGTDLSLSSSPITVTVLNAGTISPSTGFNWNASTTSPTFTSSGNSGGTWTSSNPAISIGASSGVVSVLTPPPSGTSTTTTITYSVAASGTTCTTTRLVTITNTGGVLPVTWSEVAAEKSGNMVLVKWSTASEINTKDFVVEYSNNTQQWQQLSTVMAAGNSTMVKNYSYLHQTPLKGNSYNYYRILQRDIDNKFSYSKIVSILFNEPGADVIVYPNPASDIITIYLADAGEVRLLNAGGALVWKGVLAAGNNQLPVNNLSKGIYFVVVNKKSIRLFID